MRPHLQKLLEHGLAFAFQGFWQPSWAGRGVHNWDQQVFWAEAQGEKAPPEPQGFENGDFVIEGCSAYRALFARPGYCWCGRQRAQHADQAPEIAREYLTYLRKNPRFQE